jgi:hypothetical protein
MLRPYFIGLFLGLSVLPALGNPIVITVPPGGSIVQRPLGSDDTCSAQYNPCFNGN